MTLSELSERVGITLPYMSRLKQRNVKGIRYNTLEKICEVLDCKPGDILDYEPE
ncbi:MAG: helix-turn-helix domain-containing protein [Candidatus Marinimicrobia bacterium]|nr:helix-turn-helix domain-containing protein [Candidatus Neomarinimicrobiota bacterium]